MKDLKDKNVYVLIIGILITSLIINLVGIIMHVCNVKPYNAITYKTNFEATADTSKAIVYATLKDSDVGFVEGFGPREVTLNYGHKDVPIEIKNNDKTTKTFTLVINKPDNRDTENRLYSLTTNVKKLDFDPDQYSYSINVGQEVNEIAINANLMSDNSYYVDGYGPRKVTLSEGLNVVFIRTKSQAGVEKDYKLNIFKNVGKSEKVSEEENAELDSLSLNKGHIDFKSNKEKYNVTVANDVESVSVYAFAKNKDANVTISDTTLKVGKNEIKVDVSYQGQTKSYTIVVNREKLKVSNNEKKLKMLSVGGFNLNFKPDKYDYEITADINRNLIISAYPYSSTAQVTIQGNEKSRENRNIKIFVDENGERTTYTLKIKNEFWTIKNEIVAVIITFTVGLVIVSILKYYEIKPKKKTTSKKSTTPAKKNSTQKKTTTPKKNSKKS